MTPDAAAALDGFLLSSGLAQPGERASWTPLTGGVSSDIWRVDLPGRSLCVKRALPKLKVAADWEAPVSRNAYEWAWLCFAAEHQPQAVPQPLAHDASAGLFAMSLLPPDEHPVWKAQLLAGRVEPQVAGQLGHILAHLHNASAHRDDLALAFDTLDNFQALRLEPYLLATAARHPSVAEPLRALAQRTAATRRALVHGDVSPKNILVGPAGPVLLDAECAWYGDPAFDLAFCLNHLLLKSVVRPDCATALMESYARLSASYLGAIEFEPRQDLETRVATLLPALLLARIDGKSPVEYFVDRAGEQAFVRGFALRLLAAPPSRLDGLAVAWRQAIGGSTA